MCGPEEDRERLLMDEILLNINKVLGSDLAYRQDKINDPINLKSTVHYTPINY